MMRRWIPARRGCAVGFRLVLAAVACGAASASAAPEPDWAATVAAARARWAGGAAQEAAAAWEQIALRFPVECDWLRQDSGDLPGAQWLVRPAREPDAPPLVLRAAPEAGLAADALRRIQDLAPRWAPPAAREDGLRLYARLAEHRRARRLAALRKTSPRLVFVKRRNLGGSHYAYTEAQSDAQGERHFLPGSVLCLLDLTAPRATVTPLVDSPRGMLRDPDVSYDGTRLLFAWKQHSVLDDFSLYEMDLATRQMRRLTGESGVADYEGVYLPGGGLLFNSTRPVQIVDCWWTEVSNLYTCDGDGGNIRRLTFDQVHDNAPSVLPDGRVVFTRWEYNDRGQVYVQSLHQMFPDGTGQTEFYGNNSWFPTTLIHARGIPGTARVLAVATGHHSFQAGKLAVVDPARGRQEAEGVRLAAPDRAAEAVRVDAYGQQGALFQNPYPTAEHECVVSFHPDGWNPENGAPRLSRASLQFGIYWMDHRDGRRELLASDPVLPCSQPVPVAARPVPPVRASSVDFKRTDGVCYIQDVYVGAPMEGVPRGTVKTLRVVALEYRAAGIRKNNNRGPAGGALVSTPIAIGNGAWDVKRILGDAPVAEDGSTAFRVPARTPVYFQLLDEKGQMVQSMRSSVTLQPGETASCVGCHESKNSAPVAVPPAARRAPPPALTPFFGPPRGFSFAREVQPVLDRQCVRCHDGASKEGHAFSLQSTPVEDPGAGRVWSASYLALTAARPDDAVQRRYRAEPGGPYVRWIHAQSTPPVQPPYLTGAAKSPLIELLRKGHQNVRLSAEEFARLAAWIDLAVPFCGDYTEAALWTPAEQAKYEHFLNKRRRLEAAEQAVLDRLARP